MKTVNVCGIDFKFVEREPNGRDDINMGQMDIKMGIMSIDKTMPQQIKEQTIIHEWLHGVLDLYGHESNEHLVCVLANELYQNGFRISVKNLEQNKQE